MASTQEELVCPFCGQEFHAQDDLTDHFTDDHGVDF